MNDLTILILAAGKGTRMKSDMAKALHKVNGRHIVDYVIDVAEKLTETKPIVVVGHQADEVKKTVGNRALFALQSPQLGTGHAVMAAAPLFKNSTGDMLLLYGDVPLITEKTTEKLIKTHRAGGFYATVLTSFPPDPTGYGRIIRNEDGTLNRILEHKDASDDERLIKEINTGIICFKIAELIEALGELSDNNNQKEYYITDIPEIFNSKGLRVGAVAVDDPQEVEGINTIEQLEQIESVMERKLKNSSMG